MKREYLVLIFFLFFVGRMEGVLDVIQERQSGYFFDASREVGEEEIATLIEAARWAPSAFNIQPWNFIFCDKKRDHEAYEKALLCVGKNKQWAHEAPLLVVIVANDEKNQFSEYDTGAATAQMALQAVALGLMTHQMGESCSLEQIGKAFQIPSTHKVMAIMAVGFPKPGAPKHQSTRLRTCENFFFGKWGTSRPYLWEQKEYH